MIWLGLNLVLFIKFAVCDECISNPSAYQDVFKNVSESGSEYPCVDRSLMVTIIGPHSQQYGDCPLNPDIQPSSISDKENKYWCWVSSSRNLEIYLEIAQKLSGDRFEIAAEMMRYVGFTEEYISRECSYSLAVFPSRSLVDLFVPTWAAFYLKLELPPFNVDLNWEVSRLLVTQGFYNFTGISGCNGTVVDNSCFQEYRETYGILSNVLAEAGTLSCVQEFKDMFAGGMSASLTATRAFLHGCFNANPLFTGLGYGFSGTSNELTEREYLTQNAKIEEVDGEAFLIFSPEMEERKMMENVNIEVLGQ